MQLAPLKGLNGSFEILPCCDTLQVKDYSKFNMAGFDEAHKKRMREEQFPLDLKEAFSMGARLSTIELVYTEEFEDKNRRAEEGICY